jgi:hypothetical protein
VLFQKSIVTNLTQFKSGLGGSIPHFNYRDFAYKTTPQKNQTMLPPYLCELAESSIGRVVSYQKAQVLIGDLHRCWTVHYGK